MPENMAQQERSALHMTRWYKTYSLNTLDEICMKVAIIMYNKRGKQCMFILKSYDTFYNI